MINMHWRNGEGAPQISLMTTMNLEAQLDRVLDRALSEDRIAGGVVAVLRSGKPLYRRAFGLRDRESGARMREDAVFRLASVTKPIVTTAALRLVELGSLALDAPVARYLPDFRPELPGKGPLPITIRQLLTHTAGLSYRHMQPEGGTYARANVSDGLDHPGLSMDEELRRIAAAGLSFAPGTEWGYSVGIDVAGAAMERATGRALPAIVEELVTGPLGMRDTSFAPPDRSRLATPYTNAPPRAMRDPEVVPFFGLGGVRFSPSRAFDPTSFSSGGAGMNGTVDDVARLLEAIRAGEGPVREETARSMLINQTGALPVIIGPGWGFGFGGAVLVDPAAAKSPQSQGTWTWGGVWGHSWFIDPERQLVVVAFTDTAVDGMMGPFPDAVRDAVYAGL
jgi:CubicO group peptidase (beta-lactamase class C family)